MATEETSENLSIEAAKKAALSGQDDEPLALLTVRDTVLFPHAVMPLNVGRPSSVALIESLGEAKKIGVVAQQDPSLDDPEPEDLYRIGALAIIHKVVRMPNQTLLIFTEGLSRIRIKEYREKEPFYKVSYDTIVEAEPQVDSVLEALRQNALSLFNDIIELSPSLSDDVLQMVRNLDEPGRQADFIAATIPSLGSAEKQSVLEELDIRKRLEMLLRLLSKEHEVLELRSKICASR